MTQQPEDSLQDLPQQKLKTSRLACTGSGRSAVSRFTGGLSYTVALEVDQKKAIPFFDGGRVVLLGDRVNPQSPGLAGSRRLPLPRLTFIFLSHLPSLSLPVSSHQPPLCDAQRGILQLLSAYCSCTRAKHMHARTFATRATMHTGMSALG